MEREPTVREKTLRVERAGRSALEHRLLAAGFQVAEPLFDAGIDLIVFFEEPFRAWPLQLKAATGEPVGIEKKYHGRDIYMAYVLNALDHAPRIAVLPYAEAVRIIAGPHLETASWQEKGIWRYPYLTPRLEKALVPFWSSENWFKGPPGSVP